jgi:TrmH family RNA methyltransferase
MTGRCAIIVGNEANGITEETAEMADRLVKIPMPGSAESLNASIAASIMIYEIVRQRF